MRRRDFIKSALAALAGLAAGPLPPVPASTSFTGTIVNRQLRFDLKLVNPKSRELLDQTLWLYGPAAETPTQRLDSIRASMPSERLVDPLAHTILKLVFHRVPPLTVKTVRLAADLTLASEPAPTPLADPQDWLDAERFIESDTPRIRALAAQLRRPTGRDTARAIYDWLREHLHYSGYVADDLGALSALARRQGDCTEYAYLAAALARANGIPARMVGGYVAADNAVLRAMDYHNWAEFYFDGAWRLVDAQKGRWLAPTESYVVFRIYRDKPINPIGLAHRFRMEGELEVGM